MDCRRIFAVMTRSIRMSAQMHCRAQGGQGNVIAAIDVQQHFTGQRRVAWPNRKFRHNRRRNVVNHSLKRYIVKNVEAQKCFGRHFVT